LDQPTNPTDPTQPTNRPTTNLPTNPTNPTQPTNQPTNRPTDQPDPSTNQVGVHGGALFNAFFMPVHSSVVEIRPLGFKGAWPNAYMKVGGRGLWSLTDRHSFFLP
jgi:hypothetical protein